MAPPSSDTCTVSRPLRTNTLTNPLDGYRQCVVTRNASPMGVIFRRSENLRCNSTSSVGPRIIGASPVELIRQRDSGVVVRYCFERKTIEAQHLRCEFAP